MTQQTDNSVAPDISPIEYATPVRPSRGTAGVFLVGTLLVFLAAGLLLIAAMFVFKNAQGYMPETVWFIFMMVAMCLFSFACLIAGLVIIGIGVRRAIS